MLNLGHDAVAVGSEEARMSHSSSLPSASSPEFERLPDDIVRVIASALSAALVAELRAEFGITVASPGGTNRG